MMVVISNHHDKTNGYNRSSNENVKDRSSRSMGARSAAQTNNEAEDPGRALGGSWGGSPLLKAFDP